MSPKVVEFKPLRYLQKEATDLPDYKVTTLRHIIYKFHKTGGNNVTLCKLNKKLITMVYCEQNIKSLPPYADSLLGGNLFTQWTHFPKN